LEKHLHIIALTVPYPVDYGGVFDLFYKLPALQNLGVKIHLHCFDYGRGEQPALIKYCASVHYYKRNKQFFSSLPYIVISRKNDDLLRNLLKDDHPILMEGIHCTYLLNDTRFANRKCFVRLHNVEFEYYKGLHQTATSFLKKLYYKRESKLLYKYEKSIASKATFLSVTEKDADTYRREFDCRDINYLSLFLPEWKVSSAEGKGNYCLYQGDLSVDANEKAALWLMKDVFADNDMPLVIAGKNPSGKLMKLQHKKNISLVANPSEVEMQDMIAKAHINILPSFTNTGIKLKLLNALYNGKHIVCNNATVEGTGFESLCHVAEDAKALKQIITELYQLNFTSSEIEARKTLLNSHFNNEKNAEQMVQWI
jgi:glycosyltransferase involved in cell wall biosynthesis